MIIVLTGTPGCGKTTTSRILRDRGHNVIDINQISENEGFVVKRDKIRDSNEVDTKKLNDYITEHFTDGDYILEGHLSHFLSADFVIILRCDPLILQERLSTKGWNESKIKENVAAEILDVIKVEAYEEGDKFHEIDTTCKTPNEVADDIEAALKGDHVNPTIHWLEKYEYLLFK
jgi:adenylate kinase